MTGQTESDYNSRVANANEQMHSLGRGMASMKNLQHFAIHLTKWVVTVERSHDIISVDDDEWRWQR